MGIYKYSWKVASGATPANFVKILKFYLQDFFTEKAFTWIVGISTEHIQVVPLTNIHEQLDQMQTELMQLNFKSQANKNKLIDRKLPIRWRRVNENIYNNKIFFALLGHIFKVDLKCSTP